MKPLLYPIILAASVLYSSTAFAKEEYEFPKIGTEYRMKYSAFLPAKEGDSTHVSNEHIVTLRILHAQSNGWILATQITYYYIPSEAPSEKVPERIKKESPPSWYNLNAFSEASEVEKNDPNKSLEPMRLPVTDPAAKAQR